MATEGKFSVSLSDGSEELFNHCCTPCSKQGDTVEALHQCVECEEYFCGKCIDFHSRFSATSGHKVLGKDQMGKATGSSPQKQLPTQKCLVHHGQSIEVYCADHDVICCNTCVSISHSNCGRKTYIVDAANEVQTGGELKTTRDGLNAALQDIKIERDIRQTDLETQDKDKAAWVTQVRDFTEMLIQRIRDLERSTTDDISNIHGTMSGESTADIAALDEMISVMQEDLRNLDLSQSKPASQVFVDIKMGQGHTTEGYKLIQQVTSHRKECLNLALNEELEYFLNGVGSLVIFVEDNKVYKAKLNGGYNVKIREDTNTCNIGGSCQLPDGSMVITDLTNKRLKRLDASYRVTAHCDMTCEPWGVTRTTPGEVAVTMTFLKKVQFVSTVDSMSLTRSFRTSDRCRGVCYTKDELYVSCGGWTVLGMGEAPGHVAVYDLLGTKLRTIQTDPSCQNIFSCPLHVSINSDNSRVYVADWKTGIVSFDRLGSDVRFVSDPSLKAAWGVCTLDSGHILVGGRNSHNVLQFDGDLKKVTELLRKTDEVKEPKSLCYDGNRARIVVTMKGTDTIKVFELEKEKNEVY